MRTVEEASNAMALDGIVYEVWILHNMSWSRRQHGFDCLWGVDIEKVTLSITSLIQIHLASVNFITPRTLMMWFLFELVGSICSSSQTQWLQPFYGSNAWTQPTMWQSQLSSCWFDTWVSSQETYPCQFQFSLSLLLVIPYLLFYRLWVFAGLLVVPTDQIAFL